MTPSAPLPIPAAAELDAALAPLLGPWLRDRRWFAGKGASRVSARVAAAAPIVGSDASTEPVVLATLVDVEADGARALYQVPLVLVSAGGDGAEPGADAALIGRIELDGRWVEARDATLTAAGREALWSLMADGRTASGDSLALMDRAAPGLVDAGLPVTGSRVLTGEQSNTSMIVERAGGRPVIVKLLRSLHEGENPDAVLQEALDAAGSAHVAPFIGAVRARWAGPDAPPWTGDALVAQEFLPGVEDAWRVALADAEAGRSFAEPARELGCAVARVHRTLREAMPTAPADARARDAAVALMRRRLDEAAGEVPQVREAAEPIGRLLEAARDTRWPDLQRIHGDLHLGQVIAAPDRGWVLLDFEGEPMRPLAERTEPDSPLRDLAGLLRSLDYAGGALALEKGIDASAWVRDAQAALVEGYADEAGLDAADADFTTLLTAFEADKAVYEALYEARNRPDWSPIPLRALEEIIGRSR